MRHPPTNGLNNGPDLSVGRFQVIGSLLLSLRIPFRRRYANLYETIVNGGHICEDFVPHLCVNDFIASEFRI
jgi:hypothetical protein